MDALKAAFAEIRKVRDCESVRALLFDCWQVALERGEAEGLLWAAMVRRGVEEYERRERERTAFGAWHTGDRS